MKTSAYIKEKLYLICIAFLTSCITILFLSAINVNHEMILVVSFLFWGMVLAILIIEYLRRVGYYRRLQETLTQLDKKYLITEIIEEPLFMDGRIMYDTLKIVDKSMNDYVNSYKITQKEYKEYVEMWVHEIKTPLAAAKLIISNNPNEVTHSIYEEIEKVETYVDQALFYARSTSVEKDYAIKEMQLAPTISKVIRKHSKTFIYEKIKITLTDLDKTIYSDSKWLEFIFDQIITNALKYTPSQSGEIKIYTSEEPQMTYVHIQDNGIGIPATDLPRIFDRGFTGNNGRKNEKATGMGLYLCKTLCDKLYLKISASSVPSKGTTITIGFPASDMYRMHS